jgi:hypothetical protein
MDDESMHEFGGPSSKEVHVNLSWNAVAPLNILVVVTAEESTFHPEISWLKLEAPLNISFIFSTLETSQLERSALKVSLSLNASDISVTPETSQSGITPYPEEAPYVSHSPDVEA